MFYAVYSFKIKPELRIQFLESWRELTLLIRDFEGGLGSRLHQLNDAEYIAYAQWPNRDLWNNAGDKLPAFAEKHRTKMREACTNISTVYELEMVEDLLVNHMN